MDQHDVKELVWIASALEDLRKFPAEVRQVMGFALYEAQRDGKHPAEQEKGSSP